MYENVQLKEVFWAFFFPQYEKYISEKFLFQHFAFVIEA